MIVNSTELLKVVFMILSIFVMQQNVIILLLVIIHCHCKQRKFIVTLDVKRMSTILKSNYMILLCIWQYYIRKDAPQNSIYL